MAFRVELTDKAEADVESVLVWFHQQQAGKAGGRWFAQLMEKLETLENRPERCPRAVESQDIGEDIRELLFGRERYKYRILFKISDTTIIILRVWHSSRDAITHHDLP